MRMVVVKQVLTELQERPEAVSVCEDLNAVQFSGWTQMDSNVRMTTCNTKKYHKTNLSNHAEILNIKTEGAAGVSRCSAGVCGSHCRFRNSGAGVDSRTWLVLLQAAVQRDAARLYNCTTVLQLGVVCCCRDRHYVTSDAAEFGTTSQVLMQRSKLRHKCCCRDRHHVTGAAAEFDATSQVLLQRFTRHDLCKIFYELDCQCVFLNCSCCRNLINSC